MLSRAFERLRYSFVLVIGHTHKPFPFLPLDVRRFYHRPEIPQRFQPFARAFYNTRADRGSYTFSRARMRVRATATATATVTVTVTVTATATVTTTTTMIVRGTTTKTKAKINDGACARAWLYEWLYESARNHASNATMHKVERNSGF